MPSIMPWTGCPALCRSAAQPPPPTLSAAQEGDDCEYQEYEEQYFRDTGCACGNAAEAENRSHDGNDEEDDCVVKHCCLPPPAIFALALWAASSYQAGLFVIGDGPACVSEGSDASIQPICRCRSFRDIPSCVAIVQREMRKGGGGFEKPAMTLFDGPIQLIRLKGTARL